MLFRSCVAVVSMYSKLTGSSNSVVGVTVLLAVLVLRQADFGIRTTHGLLSIAGIFGILMAGPRLANIVPPLAAFAVNAVCILLLMILGCHNVIMYNHSTFVLGYLLLLGYDVTGKEYTFVVLENLYAKLKEHVDFHFNTPVERLEVLEDRYRIITKNDTTDCSKCIVSVGRSGSKWMEQICKELDILTKSRSEERRVGKEC